MRVVIVKSSGGVVEYLKSLRHEPVWTVKQQYAMIFPSEARAEEIIEEFILPSKCHPMIVPSLRRSGNAP